MPNLICPLQLIGLHTEHPVAHPNMGLDQVQGPGPLLRAEIRIWEPGGVYLFSALGGGVLHGAATADHQLQMLQGPQILQRVFARVTMKSALLPGATVCSIEGVVASIIIF